MLIERLINAVRLRMASVFQVIAGIDPSGNAVILRADANGNLMVSIDETSASGFNGYAFYVVSATGSGSTTDLSGLNDKPIPTYATRTIREYAASPGVGLTTWVLEPSTDPAGGARECATLTAGGARKWRQRL